MVLRRKGYIVVSVGSGDEALSCLRRGLDPCLILLDMYMPDMDGWAFMAARAGDPALAGIPVVIMTGMVPSGPEWAASLGAAGFLRKPFDVDLLAREIGRCCG